MIRMPLITLAAVVAISPPVWTNHNPPATSQALQHCVVPGLESLVTRCGTVPVRENRSLAAGRIVNVRVVVIAPDSGIPLSDPVVPIPGGPGAGITRDGETWVRVLGAVRVQRPIVLIDPRGTGRSGVLDCDFSDGPSRPESYVHDFMPLEKVRACAAQLSRVADLTQYNTEAIADDLADVLTALGYARAHLYGVSGGTRQAMVFAHRYPERVRTLTLGGVVAPDFRLPLDYAQDGQRSLDLLFADCEQDRPCRAGYPAIRADFAKVLSALDQGPARVSLRAPGANPPVATVTRGIFAERIRRMLYTPASAVTVPFIVHRAALGDYLPFVEQIVPGPGGPRGDGVAMGHYLSVTCSEDIVRINAADRGPAARNTFLGDYRVQQQVDACAVWPHARLSASHFDVQPLQIPTLVISGDADPVTPPRWGESVKRYLPRTRHLVFPGGASRADRDALRDPAGQCIH